MIRLSDHFTYRRLLRYTFPSIIMLVFTSVYGVVDGFFVSNFVGKTPFAAVNFIMPFLMILGCIGFMFGTGGSALISLTLGQGHPQKANEIFSLIVYASAFLGVIFAVLGFFLVEPVASLMGAEGQLLADSILYGRIILLALPFYVLQYEFQCLFATAEKPRLGLVVTVAAGLVNMALDALFVAVFSATALSQFIGGVYPLVYFSRNPPAGQSPSTLKLVKCRLSNRRFYAGALLKTCSNGSSELMSNISMSVVSMLYNVQLMKYAGENGIAAYGVLMYVSMIFQAVFLGYSVGSAPVAGYHHGAQNYDELRSLRRKSLLLIGIFSVLMFTAGELSGRPLSVLFVGYDAGLLALTAHAFSVFSFSFLFSGFAIFGSSFFTALNDGLTSALISFLRTFVFQISSVLVFPLFWSVDGIWFSVVFAEFMAVVITVFFLIVKQKKYHY